MKKTTFIVIVLTLVAFIAMSCESITNQELEDNPTLQSWEHTSDFVAPSNITSTPSTAVPSAAAKINSPVKITVMVDAAPNIFGSTSFVPWANNAIAGIQSNGKAGDLDTPAYFVDMQNAEAKDFVATGFPAWMGQADPGNAFGQAFANEYGNRMHWVTRVLDPSGGKVDIADGLTLAYEANPIRPNGSEVTYDQYFTIPTVGGPAPIIVGIRYGSDGKLGGVDDVVLTEETGEVDEIIAVLPGVANAALCSGCTVQGQQEAIDAAVSFIESLGKFQFRFEASYGGKTTRSVLNVNR